MEAYRQCVRVAILLQVKLRSRRLVSEVGIEYVKLIALNHLWRRILRIKVSLVVLVPFKALLYAIEKPRLPHYIKRVHCIKGIFLLAKLALLSLDDVCEFLFVGTQAFFLNFMQHSK